MNDFYSLNINVMHCQYPEIVCMSLYFYDGKHTLKVYSQPTATHPSGTVVNTIKSSNFNDIMLELEKILVKKEVSSNTLYPSVTTSAVFRLNVDAKSTATFMKPHELVVMGHVVPIRNWKDLVSNVASFAYKTNKEVFSKIRRENPSWFPESKLSPGIVQIPSSNFFVYAGVSAVSAVEFMDMVLCKYFMYLQTDIYIHVTDTEKAWEYRGRKPPGLPSVN